MNKSMELDVAVVARGVARAAGALALLGLVQVSAAEGPGAAETAGPQSATGEGTASAPVLTPEQIRNAMIEAEQRRTESLRPDPGVPKEVSERWGVEVIRVASTADGFWLDFRFRVTDAQKALPLFDSRIKPYLESDESHVKLAVPSAAKVGALRTTNRGGNIKPDKIYAIMFANPGRHVKPGQKVSVVIGDFKVEHLTVN